MNRGCDWIWACAMMAVLLLIGRSYQQEKTPNEPGIRQVSPTIPQLVSVRQPVAKREPNVIEDALDQGRPVSIKVGAAAPRSFLFRPERALADGFQLTVGSYPNGALDAEPKVYEGLETEGHARASLVLIDGTVAGVIRDRDRGVTYIRTRPANGRLESRYERTGEVNAACSVDGELSEMVSLQPLKEDLWEDAEDVVVAAVNGTGAAGARSSLDRSVDPTPLGELYEVSLKEAKLVLVLDKTATGDGTPENLRAKASLYLATAANVASHFEHQLGIRILVQEIILLPDIDAQQDIPTARESKAAVRSFQDWMEANRPIHIHRWTLAAKFGAGLRSTTLGAGVIARLFSDEAVSVQRTEALWDVLAHEMGHNMGSDHTVGGLMNRETLAEGSDSFFHLMEELGDLESLPVTAAKAIHEHASSKLEGDHPLRNPEEIPWAVGDEFVTPVNTLARLQPLTNDHPQTPYGLANASLRLAELSEVIPRDAGQLDVFEDEILFLPKEDFQGVARFSYSVRGSLGNGNQGWLHRAQVRIHVGEPLPPSRDITMVPGGSYVLPVNDTEALLEQPTQGLVHRSRDDPGQLIVRADASASGSDQFTYGDTVFRLLYDDSLPKTQPDRYVIPSSGEVLRFNPLLNDGGRTWPGMVQRSVGVEEGSSSSESILPPLRLVRASNLTPFHGELTTNPLTGEMTFRPNQSSGTVRISYTVEDAAGNQAAERIEIQRKSFHLEDVIDQESALAFQLPTSDRDEHVWMLPDFDASDWSVGQAPIGFGRLAESSEDVNTKLTDNFPARQTIYLRLPFEVEDPSTLRELELSVDHEGGGLIAYLNGELVARNLIGGSSTWNMRAWAPLLGQSSRFTVDISEAIRHLRTGTNVLALHGAQYDSNGLTIVPRLRVGIANPKLVVESPKPIESRLPSGQRLVLKATGLGPNAETPVTWWVAESPPGGSVQFSEQANGTLAGFSSPGKYELLATAYHPAQPQSARRVVHVGEAVNDVPSGAVVEAGEVLPLTGLLGRLNGRVVTANVDHVEWSQDDGPGTVIIQEPNRLDTLVAFSEPGRYRLCLQVSSQGICTTDVLQVDAGRDLSIEEAPAVWFQETINVGDDKATAKAMIVGGNKRSYSVAVYYGFLGADRWNGLLDLGERSAGSFRQAIAGLRANKDYHYRILIDGKHWTPSLVFRTEESPDKRMSLLEQESELRFHVPKNESLDDVWMATDFDDSKWEKTVNYVHDQTAGLGVTYVSNIDSQSGTSAYGRMSFHLDDVTSLRDASISVRFNDAVVVYVNGQEVARSELAPEKIHWQASSLQSIPSRRGHGYWTLGLDEFQHLLVSGRNVLAVHSMHYEDNSDGFKLTGRVLITVPLPSEHLVSEPLRGYFDWASDVGLSLTEVHLGADPDRDGLGNLMKYAGVRGVAFVDADTLVYTRRRDGDSRGLSFRLESSSDLRSWAVEDFEDFEETVTELPQSEVEEVAVHLPLRDSGRRYWRVRVAILPGN